MIYYMMHMIQPTILGYLNIKEILNVMLRFGWLNNLYI